MTGSQPAAVKAGLPEATVARLPLYLRALVGLGERDQPTVSSQDLATLAGVNSATLRKDLSYLGTYGTRGVGYPVEYLRYQIAREIGATQDWPVVIVGIGNLGHALANSAGFSSRGFCVVGLFDADPARYGQCVGGQVIRPMRDLDEVVSAHEVAIGVISTPAESAQEVCDALVEAGIVSVLNFAPAPVKAPEEIDVRRVDLSTELQILAYHQQHRESPSGPIQREQTGGAA